MALNVTAGVGTTLKSRLDAGDHIVSHDCIQSGGWSMTITGLPGSLVGYAEDSAHSSGHVGLMALVVRSDAGGSLVGTDGDYAPLQVDANGALRVTGGGGGTEYTEDAASAANPAGGQLILRRRDTLSGSEVSNDGDNIAANATAKGELHVKHADSVAITAAALPLPTGAAADSTLSAIGSIVSSIAGYLDTETAAIVTAIQLLDNAISGSEMQVDVVAPLPAGTNNIGDVDVLSLPALAAGTNLIGKAAVAQDVAVLYNGTTAVTVKRAKISAASSGHNEVIAAVASKRILVLSYKLAAAKSSSAVVGACWRDGSGGTALEFDATNRLPLDKTGAAGAGGFNSGFNPTGHFLGSTNTALSLDLDAAQAVTGSIQYVEIDP